METSYHLGLVRADGATLSLTIGGEAYDPENPGSENVLAPPESSEGMVGWFRDHPHLDVGEPRSLTVDVAHGVAFEAEVTSIPEEHAAACSIPCLPLFQLRNAEPIVFFEGHKNRVTVLEVGREVVVIAAESPEDRFGEFLPRAEEALETVKWER